MTVSIDRPAQSVSHSAHSSVDGFVTLGGQRFFRIADFHSMPPFLMSIVSDSDHWMYVSSRGGLTCGRVSEDHCLFPYETDDRLHKNHDSTGPYTLIRVQQAGGAAVLWQPFNEHIDGRPIQRNIYKSDVGNEVIFEEIREDLGLAFRYRWSNSETFGFVRTATLENIGGGQVSAEIIDGLLNLLPEGITLGLQQGFSCLINAYTRCDVEPKSKVATVSLSAMIVDKAKPVESLRAAMAWTTGLDDGKILLTTDQVEAFRVGKPVQAEHLLKGRRGNYLVASTLRLKAGESRQWMIVADVDRGHSEVEALRSLLLAGGDIQKQVRANIDLGTTNLRRNVAASDGLQHSTDELATVHHFANVMFNNMRGGVFADGYKLPAADFRSFLQARNANAAERHAKTFGAFSADVDYRDLLAIAEKTGDAEVLRLTREYLPLTFGRRHGDPSRPWNRFAIKIKNPDGSRALAYQGNWRDIFQNWESLCMSFPDYIESIIAKFVNASTVDGHNPYRVTRDGIDWEAPSAEDPWANIGYWGDHQIIYLLKFLEHSRRIHPGQLEKLLGAREYCYAHVPYRIRPYASLTKDARDTIQFDRPLAKEIDKRVAAIGADGKLMPGADGGVLHVTLAEKLLVPLLAKLSNLVPDAGIWMNTQRPEWNDANNALVGPGISVVTLAYVRRHLAFCRDLFVAAGEGRDVAISPEVKTWLTEIHAVLKQHAGDLVAKRISPEKCRIVLDGLGGAFSKYREQVYAHGFAPATQLRLGDAVALFTSALAWVDHAIIANRRDDGLFHSYNLLDLANPKTAEVAHLYPMLEGQVAILSSGVLSPEESIALLNALFGSSIYRADQQSFMLYPERELPGFLQKNVIAADEVAGNSLLAALLKAGDTSVVHHDAFGQHRFNSHFKTSDDLAAALAALNAGPHREHVAAHGKAVQNIFERIFKLREFTGRSGTMYGYEGLGCIYWHMVSKLLLATQECALRAKAQGKPAAARQLAELYYRVRSGLSFNKTARSYGAFPTDPYSHTPKHSGAQQPGMTGQVKEEILTRAGEFGVEVHGGKLAFDPWLLRSREFLTAPESWTYFAGNGEAKSIALPAGTLGFTVCQTPVIFRLVKGEGRVTANLAGGGSRTSTGLVLDEKTTRAILGRDGTIESLHVDVPEEICQTVR
jgi:hypothetical protein